MALRKVASIFPGERGPLWLVLEQSHCVCKVGFSRGKTMVNPGWQDEQVTFPQSASDPTFVLIANLSPAVNTIYRNLEIGSTSK
jgi:hypothetical protein